MLVDQHSTMTRGEMILQLYVVPRHSLLARSEQAWSEDDGTVRMAAEVYFPEKNTNDLPDWYENSRSDKPKHVLAMAAVRERVPKTHGCWYWYTQSIFTMSFGMNSLRQFPSASLAHCISPQPALIPPDTSTLHKTHKTSHNINLKQNFCMHVSHTKPEIGT